MNGFLSKQKKTVMSSLVIQKPIYMGTDLNFIENVVKLV